MNDLGAMAGSVAPKFLEFLEYVWLRNNRKKLGGLAENKYGMCYSK